MIKHDILDALQGLAKRGWLVDVHAQNVCLSAPILKRYPWLPAEWVNFLGRVKEVVNPGETIWILGPSDYRDNANVAFAWDAWEKLCLDCAAQEHDAEWAARIRAFWDEHLPISLSVGSGYAYCALRREDLKVVYGIEPDFEDTSVFAGSLAEWICKLPEMS